MITDWNSKAESTFGWQRNEIIGRTWQDTIIPTQHRESHKLGLAHFAESGVGPILNKRVEMTALQFGGHVIPVEVAVFPIHGANSYSFCGFVRDISGRKALDEGLARLNEELRRSNTELQQFAYIAAHDLREPLRTIASYTALLAKQFSSYLDADTKENVAFVISATKRMQQLIDDLLTYSRIHTHAKGSRPTDCTELIEKVLGSLQTAMEETGARITYADLPVISADSSQFEQVFTNLITNALKFRSAEAPTVHITAQSQQGSWLFAFRDNGIGLEMEYGERIFQMFQRLHTMDEYPGTGIGLALCRRIIERHGGRIWVESELGRGSTFFFTVPGNGQNQVEPTLLNERANLV